MQMDQGLVEKDKPMSVRNLNFAFNPSSVALIGASAKPRTVGAVALHNIFAAEFSGRGLPGQSPAIRN